MNDLYVARIEYDDGEEPIAAVPAGLRKQSCSFGGRRNSDGLAEAITWLEAELERYPCPQRSDSGQTARWYGWIERGFEEPIEDAEFGALDYEFIEDEGFQRRYFERSEDGVREIT